MTGSKKVGKIFFFSRRLGKKTSECEEEDFNDNNLLCRFVLDGKGKEIGESIAVEKDIVIIKTKNKYLGVPLKHVEEKDKTLLVKGLIDKNKAEKMGEKWRRKSFDEIEQDEGKKDEF